MIIRKAIGRALDGGGMHQTLCAVPAKLAWIIAVRTRMAICFRNNQKGGTCFLWLIEEHRPIASLN